MSRFGLLWFLDHPAIVRRLVLPALFFVVLMAAVWLAWLLVLGGAIPLAETYPKIDFFSFWASSSFAIHRHAAWAYDATRLHAEQLALRGNDATLQPWRNPPFFFFLVLPLSLLPVAASLAGWVFATVGLMEAAVWRITRNWKLCLMALLFPGTIWNAFIGQTGFLIAGLLGWGIVLLPRRPVLAGLPLALIAIKPQFFPLVLVALFAGGKRQALAGVMVWLIILALLSLVFFGIGPWISFITISSSSAGDISTANQALAKMQSVAAEALLLGAGQTLADAIQVFISLASAAFVFWLWARETAFEYKATGLAVAIILAAPYSYHYDLQLLALATIWLVLASNERGWLPMDLEILAVVWLVLYVSVVFGPLPNLTPGPILCVALLAVLVRRVRRRTLQPELVPDMRLLQTG